jgi:hypothetical protein
MNESQNPTSRMVPPKTIEPASQGFAEIIFDYRLVSNTVESTAAIHHGGLNALGFTNCH